MNHENKSPAHQARECSDGDIRPLVTVTVPDEIINCHPGVDNDGESLSTGSIRLGVRCSGFDHDVWAHNVSDAERKALSTMSSYALKLVMRNGQLRVTHLQPEGGEWIEFSDLLHY